MVEAGSELARAWNPSAPENIADPYAFYAEARRDADIFYSDVLDGWVLTRYRDVEAVVTDHERFSNASAIVAPPGLDAASSEILTKFGWRPNFDTDPPAHTRIRQAVTQAFTARRIAALEPAIRESASALLDDLARAGSPGDLVAGFCLPLPSRVIFGMLGVPEDDLDRVHGWTTQFIEVYVAHIVDGDSVQRAQGCVDYWDYCIDLIERRSRAPQDDLISQLVANPDRGGPGSIGQAPLRRDEIASIFMLLVVAGHETTSNMLASLLLHLLTDRSRWEEVAADPALRPAAVEEALRIDAPVQLLHRVTLCPVQVAGVELPAGAKVLVPFGPVNHDDAVFEAPDLFDFHRERSAKHLAFSKGVHYCLGAVLARLEGRVALDCLVERFPGLRLADDGPVRYHPIHSIRSLQELNLAW